MSSGSTEPLNGGRDSSCPRLDLVPSAEVAFGAADGEHEGALAEAELVFVELAGEKAMLARIDRRDDRLDLNCFVGGWARRVAGRAAAEDPARAARELLGAS